MMKVVTDLLSNCSANSFPSQDLEGQVTVKPL